MTVSVTTQRTPSASDLVCAVRVGAVDDEHVDEPLVARGDAARRGASGQPLEHPVGGALDRAAADDRADRDARARGVARARP